MKNLMYKRLIKAGLFALLFAMVFKSVNAQQAVCNWYGTHYPLCITTTSGWGWENNKSCISRSTCSSQPAPYGIVGSTGASSLSNSSSSTGCPATAVTPYLKVGAGNWQQTGTATLSSGASVVLGPHPHNQGRWVWSGCETSGTAREQTLTPTMSCQALATFTNDCGTRSTYTFQLTVSDTAGMGMPTLQSTRIHLIGDSTVMSYRADAYPMMGWGQVLPFYFDANKVTVRNHAIGGRSSRSFYQEGRWATVYGQLQAGDYVFIQFGHNDRDSSKAERYTSPTDYRGYLRTYVNETRARGAVPVLVSPMVINAYRNNILRNVFTETGAEYRNVMAEVATELDVAFVDLNKKSHKLISKLGNAYAARYSFMMLPAGEYPNYPAGSNDGTHFQEMGANEMARLIIEGLEDNQSRIEITRLLTATTPRYFLKVTSSLTNGGMITQSRDYPAGTPLTLKAVAASGHSFTRWLRAGQSISTSAIYQTTMPQGDLEMTAVFDNRAPAVPYTAFNSATSYLKAKAFIIGDSTVSNYNTGYAPQTGWGQLFGLFFDPNKIVVDNRAIGGRSAKSYYNDHWASVKSAISPGDFVFIQFGINDRNSADPARYAPTDGTFQNYLTWFAQETRALGATPIFVSTLVRNAWVDGFVVYEAYHEHPIVTRELAASLNVPLVDLDGKSTNLLERAGPTYSEYFYYMNLAAGEYPNYPDGRADDVHLQTAGALEMARLVAESVKEMKNVRAIAPLVGALKPTYTYRVITPSPKAGLVTRLYQYPAGVPLTLKARPSSSTFTAWLNCDGSQLSKNRLVTLTSAATNQCYYAVFDNRYPR
jgi:lysophospholipase L1-like esterase